MTEWISVKERLPEKNGRYLVAYGDETASMFRVEVMFFETTHWIMERGKSITHWMPLPDLPDPELKPCPFCQGKALVTNAANLLAYWVVRCTTCYMTTPTCKDKGTVISIWNRREEA